MNERYQYKIVTLISSGRFVFNTFVNKPVQMNVRSSKSQTTKADMCCLLDETYPNVLSIRNNLSYFDLYIYPQENVDEKHKKGDKLVAHRNIEARLAVK